MSDRIIIYNFDKDKLANSSGDRLIMVSKTTTIRLLPGENIITPEELELLTKTDVYKEFISSGVLELKEVPEEIEQSPEQEKQQAPNITKGNTTTTTTRKST